MKRQPCRATKAISAFAPWRLGVKEFAFMRKQAHFTPELFKFLRQLKRHNNRDWFLANKNRYEDQVRDPFLRFIEDLRPRLHQISPHFIADPRRSGGSLLRIYRDLRFRPDADPYQTRAAARFPHTAWKQTRTPGFYLHLEPGTSFLGCGLWHPDPETRNAVIESIVENPAQWKKILGNKKFRTACEVSGEKMKRMPPGYDANHPLAEDLKRKDFITATSFKDAQVCAADFFDQVTETLEATAPFMEFLTRALGLPWASGDKVSIREVMDVESPRIR
jgi:uncharacterized protein (TIGR02453 family)